MMADGPYGLACLEIWGGNHRVEQDVSLPGLAGWIYSEPAAGSAAGGDVYYVSLCSQGALARISVADVSGHGQEASRVGDCLREMMRKHINTFDQSVLVHELNHAFEQHCWAGKFATVVFLGIYGQTGQLVLTNGGHPPPLWYRAASKEWTLLQEPASQAEIEAADLPLGVIPGTNYRQLAVRLEPGDLVFLYSDALSDIRNRGGQLLRPEGLLELARPLPVDSPATAGKALLAGVQRFAGGQINDDRTLITVQRVTA